MFRPSCRKTEPVHKDLAMLRVFVVFSFCIDTAGGAQLAGCGSHTDLLDGWKLFLKAQLSHFFPYYLLKYFASDCPAFLGKNTRLKKKKIILA